MCTSAVISVKGDKVVPKELFNFFFPELFSRFLLKEAQNMGEARIMEGAERNAFFPSGV